MAATATFGIQTYPTMAAPWASSDDGEAWVWGDFFLILQTKPKTVAQVAREMTNQRAVPESIQYLFAMTVFHRQDRNPSSCPVLSVGLEQSNFMHMGINDPKLFASLGLSSSGTGPVHLGVFTARSRENLGRYNGQLDPESVRTCFFEVARRFLELPEEPTRIGVIHDVWGHPLTGKPRRPIANSKQGCLVPMIAMLLIAGSAFELATLFT